MWLYPLMNEWKVTNGRKYTSSTSLVLYKMCCRCSGNISVVVVMRKWGDLTNAQKGIINGFPTEGGSIPEIEEFVNYSRGIVLRVSSMVEYHYRQEKTWKFWWATSHRWNSVWGATFRRNDELVYSWANYCYSGITCSQSEPGMYHKYDCYGNVLYIGIRSRRLVRTFILTTVH